ncbi:hypothetical protein IW249_006131 [Micromonospora vinacea]|uniref:Uncharacterized protein n=1 Tax=Micromonospora vinacea TaxID=709878 RepID=A0ABS0KCN8_9ACTN|nr:hypothetical protein [Micromonospora vinacea]MBG6105717.1 hypothetical protein [Micromonospora vinacea]
MSTHVEPGRHLREARQHHLAQVNGVLRRPGTYGRDEMAERLLLEAMAAVEGSLTRWQSEFDGLRERDAFAPTGVRGAYSYVLPVEALRDATASVYAEIAHRLGWLELDRTLSEAEFEQLSAGIGDWVSQDRTLSAVIERFGPPSLWIGGPNAYYPKTLAYATARPEDDLVCFLNRPGAGRDLFS